ncbi:MAG TPA: phenylacetate--CoA ligase PaaK [Gammaproteobacteria bacterium]|nr:phenylacetate--CoA ligase PaaK [Gammaproteobacteria bacterium]
MSVNLDRATREPIEMAGLDELRALQLERLRWSLRHAYENVPYYRKSFAAAGVYPEDLRELADLARFPFTTKQDLRDHYPFGMFAVPREKLVRIHASSGTTGKPTVVGYTRGDIDLWADLIARTMRAGGARPGDLCHIAFGYGLFTGGLGFHYGAERLGCTVIPMSGGQSEKQIQLIQDFQPRLILVTPSYCLNLIDEMEKQGIDPAGCSLEIGIFGAEPWTDAMRDELERRLGIQALDTYGLSEVIGPGVAMEYLDTKDGLTVWEDHFFPEIIDPETGAVLPDGAPGELVFTSLTKEALPIIRYRTRDLTRLLPGTGRAMRRMQRVTGRSDDMLIIRGVNVFPSQVEEQILYFKELAPHYQLEVYRERHLDEVRVLVEWNAKCSDFSAEEQLRVEAQLKHRIKAFIGISVDVLINEPGAIPRSQGKAQRVIDRRRID